MSPTDIFIISIFILVTVYAIKGSIEYWKDE